MRTLPRTITGLVIYLLIIYNIERITIEDIALVDIKGFVYVLIAVSIISIIQFEWLRSQNIAGILVITTVIYFIGKYFVFYYYTRWNENTVYLIITEIAVLWLGILLAKQVGSAIKDFSDAVESITFSDLEKTKNIDEALHDIQTEFYRSRRYNYPLTLIVVQPETSMLDYQPQKAIKEIQQTMLSRYATVSLARELSKELRLLDTIIDLKRNLRFAILYPQTDGDKADLLINRINNVASSLDIGVTCGHASFPTDALTFEELLNTATNHIRYPLSVQPISERSKVARDDDGLP